MLKRFFHSSSRRFSASATVPTAAAAAPVSSIKHSFLPCWCCQIPFDICASFCPYCHKISSAPLTKRPEMKRCSYFDLLQPPDSPAAFNHNNNFSVDTKALEQTYRKLAMQLHPDQFSSKSSFEQELSALHASKLNEAYSTLKNPLRRAMYLFDLRGVKHALGEDNASPPPPHQTDMEILTETMELREQLMEASGNEDLDKLKLQVDDLINQVEVELASAIGDVTQIDTSVRTAVRLRYLEKVRNEIKEKQQTIM